MAPYIADQIFWTTLDSHRHSRILDYSQHYYGYKFAKDFILHSKKEVFTYDEIKEYFETNVMMNYLNDFTLAKVRYYIEAYKKGDRKANDELEKKADAILDGKIRADFNPCIINLNGIKLSVEDNGGDALQACIEQSLAGYDPVFLFWAEIIHEGTMTLYTEQL